MQPDGLEVVVRLPRAIRASDSADVAAQANADQMARLAVREMGADHFRRARHALGNHLLAGINGQKQIIPDDKFN